MITCETKALADGILRSGINSFIFSYLFALIWGTLGLVTFLTFLVIKGQETYRLIAVSSLKIVGDMSFRHEL